MKVGDTGIIIGGKNPATGDCFWQAQILVIDDDDTIYVHLEDDTNVWIAKSRFTPMYIRKEQA